MSRPDREFTVVLDGVAYHVEMHGNSVVVNGQPFVVGFGERGVDVDGTLFEVKLKGGTAEVNGIAYSVAIEGLEGSRQVGPSASAQPAGMDVTEAAGVVTAIMPGKVIRLLVSEGDELQEGDVVVILEAMKMENELRTDRAGVVKQVNVAPGDDVELGQVLVVVG